MDSAATRFQYQISYAGLCTGLGPGPAHFSNFVIVCPAFVSPVPTLLRAQYMPHSSARNMQGRSRFVNGAVSLTVVAALTTLSCAFKAEEFRYCQDSSFCRRHRKFDGSNAPATYFLHGAQQQADGSVSGAPLFFVSQQRIQISQC